MSESDTSALEARLDPRDRGYIEGLTDTKERETIVSTILCYQQMDRLGEGDAVPSLELLRVENASAVRLDELVTERLLVLVFGSYT